MSQPSSPVNILIVEDEWIIALDIKRHLSKLGYGVAGTANCAEKALELVAKTQPDLVLMDIYLQGETTGIETSELIRQQFHLPIVFLTAHADEATLTEAIATRPQGYVVKPFEEQDLSVAIQVALANHRAERGVQQALEQEKQLNELKSQFVSIVSHEFRNPLSSILLTLELLEQTALTPEKRAAHIQRAKNTIHQMSQLITDVLVVGEVERGQFQCESAPIDIIEFCSNLVEELQSLPKTKHDLVITVRGCNETEHPFYELDPKLLHHILSNLLENAIKYSPAGSKIIFDLQCELDFVQFQIQDRGIGLTKADREKLFTPFHRGSNVGKIRGTGLGLSIVKKCVDAHGGKIGVVSELSTGSIFTVTLYSKQSFNFSHIPHSNN
ncbi:MULTISPECIES: hybrid sensor histidine kinase/response regulator [Nostocales]|uniref:histidine kinase n=3 Tax=Nostocales TaxID=1161 RepID=A0A8S9T8H3_9CYAN|nr:ATP-binding protein [Tolypothrix bouteillei]KAF3888705.1 hybrid sensor histidine kinase/response regulator [Tolypothrix bouteillei VB521301]